MNREQILAEIRRTAKENGDKPLGIGRFQALTGIKASDWQGKYWIRWGEALMDAGFKPNQLRRARSDEDLLGALASLVRDLGHFPVKHEINLRARNEPGFPWNNTFAKFGGRKNLARRLYDFSKERGQEDVAIICDRIVGSGDKSVSIEKDNDRNDGIKLGYVYLIKHGSRREYKIGRTYNPLRREGEIGIELPERAEPIHQIATDDPAGIETYWHRRFAEKRLKNEWFELAAQDVQAFKRWRKIW